MKTSPKMPRTAPRLVWIQQAPEPGGRYVAGCGPYSFEISKMPDHTGYALQMWQIRPEDWPLVVWEMDGFSLPEAKGRAERLALLAWVPQGKCGTGKQMAARRRSTFGGGFFPPRRRGNPAHDDRR